VNVIICDDHAVFADSLALVIADAGHRVVGVVYSPDDALSALRAASADVCLIDLHFPGESVLERLPELRATAPDTRFVVLTGFLEQEVLDAGVDAGVRGFAHKGQQAQEIIELLSRVHDGELVVDGATGRAP